jgi:hypothetical protein
MTASSKDLIETAAVQFQPRAWYEGVLSEAPVTFQVLELRAGAWMRIQVFRTFYAGRMLTTEEWVKRGDLAGCKDTSEPEDDGSW